MMPISPISAYTRTKKFVATEWKRYFGDDFIAKDKLWTSLIRGGQAIVDPEKSYRFFSSPNFQPSYLMDGDSRAYYLIYAAMLAQG
jgi:endo-1,3(4)-beta-glucanase